MDIVTLLVCIAIASWMYDAKECRRIQERESQE